ncbi:ankyrin repeat domain-containing protein 40 [Lepeophtheirus salmonis]|uniref:ankyrin repeat domain-containing protein 40 n=1 Tax=Lepeophtheirus salmonis TaxID=72036 RepID=UPI001AE20402|nr:ankyrin repeat domain-containing protein 40-like [Lepeophtheirus salmonis]
MELLEASCYGDIDTIKTLLHSGVDPNYTQKMNGWSALHWAAKRNYLEVVELLLSNGANAALKTRDSKMPSDLATDNKVLAVLNAPPKNSADTPMDSFIPNYIKYPPLSHKVDLSNRKDLTNVQESTPIQFPELKETKRNMTILKVKLKKDEYFIEVDIFPSEIHIFDDFVSILVNELNIQSINDVSLILKLPDTKLRRIEEVKRLANYQELIVIRTKS